MVRSYVVVFLMAYYGMTMNAKSPAVVHTDTASSPRFPVSSLGPSDGTTIMMVPHSYLALDRQAKEKLQSLIRHVLVIGWIRDEVIDDLLNDSQCMDWIHQSMCHPSLSAVYNYEWLEIMGDAIINRHLVWYIAKRFPQLRTPEGVKIIARLKINLVSKQTLSEISIRLGLPSCIRYQQETVPSRCLPSLYEDVLEALFAALELSMNHLYGEGAGSLVTFRLLGEIFDLWPISLAYEDLFDPITRLKETLDLFHGTLGQMRYSTERCVDNTHLVSISFTRWQPHMSIGVGQHTNMERAKQIASRQALTVLHHHGFSRRVHEYYQQIQSPFLWPLTIIRKYPFLRASSPPFRKEFGK